MSWLKSSGRSFLAASRITRTVAQGMLCSWHTAQMTCDSDRKSTRLNSSHLGISYAVFCLKKKKKHKNQRASPSASPHCPRRTHLTTREERASACGGGPFSEL